jgi:hypothetical protein
MPRLQIKIMAMTFGIALLVVLFNFLFSLLGVSFIESGPRVAPESLIERFYSLLWKELAASAVVAIPLAAWAGWIYSFKFCGPIRHFRQFFQGHLEGRWDEPLSLRKGDELQDVKDAINASQAVMSEAFRREQALLADACRVLEAATHEVKDSTPVKGLLLRMELERRELDRRLCGGPAPSAKAHVESVPAAQEVVSTPV